MSGTVEKIKSLIWLRNWHHFKDSATSNTDDSTSQRESIARQRAPKHKAKWWMSNWNSVSSQKRSCAHTKDAYLDSKSQNTLRSQLVSSASDRLLHTRGIGNDRPHRITNLHKGSRSDSLDLHYKVVDELPFASLFSVRDCVSTVDQSPWKQHGVDVDTPACKLGLKNRVLPLVVQENLKSSGPHDDDQEDVLGPLPKRAGSISLKKVTCTKARSSSPESPRDVRWKKLLSYSRSSSPRSSSYFLEWSSNQRVMDRVMTAGPTGSLSTMGSPWNSRASSRHCHGSQRSSFRSSYEQGQWITTDSEFVVLEL